MRIGIYFIDVLFWMGACAEEMILNVFGKNEEEYGR